MGMLNVEVTELVEKNNHPLIAEINELRTMILRAHPQLEENIKWNGPNYRIGDHDRITMRIHPPKQIQLIFHRGAKKLAQPADRLIEDPAGLLQWKENDRAIMTFKSMEAIRQAEPQIKSVVQAWIRAAK